MSNSCSKDELELPEGLNGVWETYIYQFDSIDYYENTGCNLIAQSDDVRLKDAISIFLTFEIDINGPTYVTDNCLSEERVPYQLIFDNERDIIKIDNPAKSLYVFKVLSYDKTGGLVLELIHEGMPGNVPLHGIYTLQLI